MKIVENSGQIEIISPYGRIYLYTHENSKELVQQVHDILSKNIRWDDPDYLSRMLFCKMIPKEFWDDEKGFGIGTEQYVDINILVSLDTTKSTIGIYSVLEKEHYNATFEEFVNNYPKNASL
jgi:hypothetical protein